MSDNLIGALYEDLHGPPVIISHPIQKPLKQRTACKQKHHAVPCEACQHNTEVNLLLKLCSDLAGSLAVVELFGQEFDPLQHGGLEATEQEGHT